MFIWPGDYKQTGSGSCCRSCSGRIMLTPFFDILWGLLAGLWSVRRCLGCDCNEYTWKQAVGLIWWCTQNAWYHRYRSGFISEHRSASLFLFHLNVKRVFLTASQVFDSINAKMLSQDKTPWCILLQSCPKRAVGLCGFFFYSFWSTTPSSCLLFSVIFTAYVPHKTCGVPSLPHCLLFWSLLS